MKAVRVRFAPSPTGPLHIGGVRTALYNYLFARKHNGTFILRIEDTDQKRFVNAAEEYILDALKWLEIEPDEGPTQGGDYGPYKQSERSAKYSEYVQKLIEAGKAYYAFDTPAELEAARLKAEQQKEVFKYGVKTRNSMKNSLTLSAKETETLIKAGAYTIRMKIPAEDAVSVDDAIRGKVTFQSEELDDKVIMKADGLPTYHLANVVDDRLMDISHVIRGEEWLPSTGHHVYLYQFFNWKPPVFAHLPLILKPNGKGKLSKRDGQKLGLPVFPLAWTTEEESFKGFKEYGFEKDAVLNFLALLGWNPGTDQEIFTLNQLEEAFELDRIGKSGARFDYDKAKWFNQQYIIQGDTEKLAASLLPMAIERGFDTDQKKLTKVMEMMQERLVFATDLFEEGAYFFKPVDEFDQKLIKKKWDSSQKPFFVDLLDKLGDVKPFKAAGIKEKIVAEMEAAGLKFGQVLPILRLGLSGTIGGPDVFELIAFLGYEESKNRILKAMETWG